MERIVLCLAVGLLCMGGTSAQQANNATYASGNGTVAFASGSGSGSASGSADCSSAGCSHNCTDTTMGPMCMCPAGMQLGDDMQNCEACPGGTWGSECARNCSHCGPGNPCDAVTGECRCNPCWSGAMCNTALGADCFLQFLQTEQKTVGLLNVRYGGYPIPLPPDNTLTDMVANLMEVTANVLQDVNLEIVDRTEVNQGPVAKLTWTVDYNPNRPAALRGLLNLENKVKIGDVRATLVIQTLTNTAEVTLNAGTSM